EETSKPQPEGGSGGVDYSFVPLSSLAEEADVISMFGRMPKNELEEARELKRSNPGFGGMSVEQIAGCSKVFKLAWGLKINDEPKPPEDNSELPYGEQARLRRECQKLASERDELLSQTHGTSHADWLRMGGMPAAEASLDDLRRKRDWLQDGIQRVRKARQPTFFD